MPTCREPSSFVTQITGRLIRSRQLAHLSGFPSISSPLTRFCETPGGWRLTQTPYKAASPQSQADIVDQTSLTEKDR